MTLPEMFAHLAHDFHYVTVEKQNNAYLVKVWEDTPHPLPQGWMSLKGKYDAWAILRSLPNSLSTNTPYLVNDLIRGYK